MLSSLLFNQANFSPVPPIESSSSSDGIKLKTKTPFQPHKILYPAPNGNEEANWVGLSPLDMVQQIVSMAENTASFHANHTQSSVRQLLQKITNPELNKAVDCASGKRKSRGGDENEDAALADDHAVLALIDSVDVSPVDDKFNPWTPSSGVSLEESIIYSGLDGWITRLEPVAQHSRNKWVLPSYNRVQQQFQSSVSKGDDVLLAIKTATSQMMTLAGMLCESPVPTPKPLLEVKSAPVVSFEAPAVKAVVKNKMLPADAFQHYMDFWLKTNWM